MEVTVGMSGQPGVILLVDAVIVEDEVDFFIVGHIGNDIIHKFDELDSPLPLRCFCMYCSGSHLQGSEEVEGAVSFVGALLSSHNLAV